MPFYKYRTDLGNTVNAKSATSFTGMAGNEAQISSTIDTPVGQQLYLYKVSAGALIENDDTTIATYTTSTGTAINGSPTMAQFTGYTGTTAPTTYQSKSSIVTFTGTTLPNTYLTKVAFNSYTGSSAGITTASNGIRKNGTNVRLGGSLTGSTNIGLGTFNLIFTGSSGTLRYGSDLSASYNIRSLVDRGYVTGITSTLVTLTKINTYTGTTAPNQFAAKSAFLTYTGTTAPLTYQSKSSIVTYTGTTAPATFANKATFNSYTGTTIGSATNGLRQNGITVRLGGSLTGNTNIGLGTFNLVFTGASGTLRYGSDLSASYNIRSIVDKGYVTGITSILLASANNGLTENGVNVRLGGTLTGGTTITSPATGSRLIFAGFPVQYSTDVSASYNNRSLVDLGYVTGTTQGVITWKNNATTLNTPPVEFSTINFSSGATLVNRGSGVLEVKFIPGSEVFNSGRTTTQTNATATFVDYLAKGFVLAGGTYKIEYTCKASIATANTNLGIQLLIDGVAMEAGTNNLYRISNANARVMVSPFTVATLSAGSHSFRLQFSASSGTATAEYGWILITRIA